MTEKNGSDGGCNGSANLPSTASAARTSSHDLDRDLRSQEQSIRSLLRKGRLTGGAPRVDLLSGVQRKIRERSRGRFYADGWSTDRAATSTYIVTSLLMLVIVMLVYFVLVPALPIH